MKNSQISKCSQSKTIISTNTVFPPIGLAPTPTGCKRIKDSGFYVVLYLIYLYYQCQISPTTRIIPKIRLHRAVHVSSMFKMLFSIHFSAHTVRHA